MSKTCICGNSYFGFGDFCSPACGRHGSPPPFVGTVPQPDTVSIVPEKIRPAEPVSEASADEKPSSAISGKERARRYREKNLDKNREYMRDYMRKRREK